MVGASAKITYENPELAKDFEKFAQAAPDLFARKVPSAARRVTRFAKATLRGLTPGPVHRPIRWTPAASQNKPPNTRWGYYSKQKAAYFATNGFGRGIPSQRSGKLESDWTVTTKLETDASGVFAIENQASYAQFVVGVDQQGFHAITGWPNITGPSFVRAEDQIREFASDELANLHTSLVDDYLERFT